MKKVLAFYGRVSYNKQCQGNKTADGVWRSLVARSAGGREVAGSNPVAPIFIRAETEKASALFVFLCYSSFSTPFIPRITNIVITISAIAIGSAIQADWTKPAMM